MAYQFSPYMSSSKTMGSISTTWKSLFMSEYETFMKSARPFNCIFCKHIIGYNFSECLGGHCYSTVSMDKYEDVYLSEHILFGLSYVRCPNSECVGIYNPIDKTHRNFVQDWFRFGKRLEMSIIDCHCGGKYIPECVPHSDTFSWCPHCGYENPLHRKKLEVVNDIMTSSRRRLCDCCEFECVPEHTSSGSYCKFCITTKRGHTNTVTSATDPICINEFPKVIVTRLMKCTSQYLPDH